MNGRVVVLSLILLGTTLFVSPPKTQAQFRFASAPSRGVGVGASRRARAGRRGFVRGGPYWIESLFAPYFYSDDDSDRQPVVEAPPSEGSFVQLVSRASPAPAANPPEALVIELQGDHWVQITEHGQAQVEPVSQAQSGRASFLRSASEAAAGRIEAGEPARELPPAVLVYRDGHTEEIGKYAIVGATIYTQADYWSSGSWTRRVQVADLDVAATLKLNQARGARFSLPSGPNEVMIRP